MLKVKVLTLVPEAFPGILGSGLVGKAMVRNAWKLETFDIRKWGDGSYNKVDDKPYGGGAGMVLMADVISRALDDILSQSSSRMRLVYASARGRKFTQQVVHEMASNCDSLVILCGRFEGIDQRVIDFYGIEEFCVGDFVMSGGEIAAMAMIDACVRLLPGVLGNDESVSQDSFNIFQNGTCLIEYPQYTRPRVWRGLAVPEELVSGDHAAVRRWKEKAALSATEDMRPDLLSDVN